MNKIAVTGSSGFLGSHFLDRVEGEYHLYSKGSLISDLVKFQPEYIYHFAAEIYSEQDMIQSNILLTHDLLEASREIYGLKAFVYVGSSSEYGRKKYPMVETDFLDPTTIYEATKGASTLLCQAYARSHGIPAMIARPFSLYGKHEPKHRFIPTIIRSIEEGSTLRVAPGVHDYIHADDFVDGLQIIAENPKPGEIYNFGTGVQTSNEELVTLIEEIMGKKATKEPVPQLHSYDSDSWVADNHKASLLGWTARPLRQGLTETIEQIRRLS